METHIGPDDQIIFISEDYDKIHLSKMTSWDVRKDTIQSNQPATPKSKRILMLGWNRRAPLIINQLDYYLAPGSQLFIVANTSKTESEIRRHCHGSLRNMTCTFQLGDATDRQLLNSLAIETYNHVILLCYSDIMDVQQADALTIMTLLHLRDIADHCGNPFSIVSEMLDIRDRNLVDVTQADDFIVSDDIISLLMAQVVENKHLNDIFTDIFNPEGSEIYLKPAENYVKLDGKPVNMYTVIAAARQRNEVAIGYRLHAQINDTTKNHGVVVNPKKSALVTFSKGNQVIVFAEN
jgi:ion channel POLLUX/CASTOR